MTAYSEWKSFVNNYEVNSSNLDIEIFKAWVRCRKIGVDPFTKLAKINRNCKDILTEEGRRLINVIKKYRTMVDFIAKSAAALIVVADANGFILKVTGNKEMVGNAACINLKPNADWSEKNIGNNFIGSAIATEKESVVEGYDHYCMLLHNFSGIGIPVYSSGNLIGVIGIAVLDNNSLNNTLKELGKELAILMSIELEREQTAGKAKKEVPIPVTKTGAATYNFEDIAGHSSAINEAIQLARMAAKSDLPVLVLGESGTGKEVIAQAIHNNSYRRNGPFVAINCGAFPRELISSELFGYVEGAFTGAKKGGYIGKFEAANKGTLFLDEIGDMPLELQITLLRVLQEKKITKIGDYRPIPVDVRIIAATNKDLVSEISWSGTFRSDLYYRLNAITIVLPPLRERKEDIAELALYFLEEIKKRHSDTRAIAISDDVMNLFMNYSWPGNVRELKNIIERAYYFAEGRNVILKEHLPKQLRDFKNKISKSPSMQTIDQAERETIRRALENNRWNIKQTAEMLGIARSTLYRKIEHYKLNVK